ncbi:helix-turn-helix transcriptional regulator [Burkholderia cepacia]|uniref:helix-turn-helix transcriptional regulator n=1 Tax=Burkholderia cepacia TaxID=292 RepID=UPI002AB668C8|nr:helix-turn-helix transcriptional regulator [Burkholderia cepacia]
MSKSLPVRIINDPDGAPAFVVIPYADYVAQRCAARDLIPHELVTRVVFDGSSPARAWREHLGLTRAEVARRIGISRSDYAKQEKREKLRKSMRKKIAAALDITIAQLDFWLSDPRRSAASGPACRPGTPSRRLADVRESRATTTPSVDRGGRPRIAPTPDGCHSVYLDRSRCPRADRCAARAARASARVFP